MMYWILCVTLLAGASAAYKQQDVQVKTVQPSNLAVLQNYPSIVQIEYFLFWSTIDWSHECGGSILTSRMVLSASSCFTGWSYEPRFRRVRAGSANRRSGGLIFYVQDRLNHPNFLENDYSGDVSVVRLLTAIVYNPIIQQASIASPASIIPNNLILSQPGWGRNQAALISHQQLRTADKNSCGRRDGNFSLVLNNTQNILCALHVNANVVANDDVGGPWIFDGITVGIVGGLNTMNVYSGMIGADVARYTEWIVEAAAGGW